MQGMALSKGYGTWFAVDPLCAVTELRMLGVAIGEERKNQIMASIEARADARRRRKEFSTEAELEARNADGDDIVPGLVTTDTPCLS